jgi:hypothetical protein
VGKAENVASDGANIVSWIGDYDCVALAGAGNGDPFGMIWLGHEQVHWRLVWLAELRRPEWRKTPHFSDGMVRQTRFPVSSGGSSILRSTATKDGPDDTGQWPVPPSYGLLALVGVR